MIIGYDVRAAILVALILFGGNLIYVFKKDDCPACHYLYWKLTEGPLKNHASHVKFVDVKFNEEQQCNTAYLDGEPTDGPCPVEVVPAAYFKEADKLIYGVENIEEEIFNGSK